MTSQPEPSGASRRHPAKPRLRLLTGLLVLACLVLLASASSPTAAQSENRVALIVGFEDGSAITRCVSFSEAEITGLQVLQRSGLSLTVDYQSIGAAVCAIEGTGCPADECLTCDPAYRYWSYWHWRDGAWAYANTGAEGYTVVDGDVEGWQWGGGDPPPVASFSSVCVRPATATPTASPTTTATATPRSQATSTPGPNVLFWADGTEVEAGTCTTIRWVAENVRSATINSETVAEGGFITACPCESTEYVLEVVTNDGATMSRTLTIDTSGSCPDDATATPAPTSAPTHAQSTASRTPTPVPSTALPTLTATPSARAELSPVQPRTTATPEPTATLLAPPEPEDTRDAPGTPSPDPTVPAPPSATPTRAAVEGFADTPSGDRIANTGIVSGLLAFGLLLALIGLIYVFLVRGQ